MFLEDVPGLHVTVLVKGQQVAEFDDEGTFPSHKEKSKYIEAVSDANFAIKLNTLRALAPAPEDLLAVSIYLDGKYVSGPVADLQKLLYDPRDRYESIFSGKNVRTREGYFLERYKFAQLQTNDGPVGKAKLEDFKHLGEIKVTCKWCRQIGDAYQMSYTDQPSESAVRESVPEKCLKGRAISSRAILSAREVSTPNDRIEVTYPYGPDPFATFRFKYRSRGDLQIEGIIPRSPSPLPLEERDPDDLSPEEARELVRRLRVRQQQQQIEIKKEGKKKKRARSATPHADDGSDEVVVTGATSSRKRSRQSTDSGIELIDLTED